MKKTTDSDKTRLREELRAVNGKIIDKKGKSAKINDLLLPILNGFNVVALYSSTESEVDTLSTIKSLLASGKTVALPRVKGKDMDFYKIDEKSLRTLNVGAFGIKEPESREENLISPRSIAAIVCPALGFDKDMVRLGHGGGYYDRYLKRVSAFKVGVCFSEQLVKTLPCGEFDIKMDAVITDKGIILPS